MRQTMMVLVLLLVLPSPAPACDICSGAKNQTPLSEEMDRAKLVFYGTALQSRLLTQPGSPSSGQTDFRIERVLKYDPLLGQNKTITLERYVPILDPKNPPKYLVFCGIKEGKPDPLLGKPVSSGAILDFLDRLQAFKNKDRLTTLLFCFSFMDHPDELVANDAFLVFARSSNQEVGEVARRLAPDKLRKMLQSPALKADRFSLLAFLLGACGTERDAVFLRRHLEKPNEQARLALDGILAGYIHLRPRQGWDLAHNILADSQRPFLERYTVVRTLRFYRGWKWAETKPEILSCQVALIEDSDLADLAIEDLRTWEVWDLTAKILAQYGKPSHATPIIKRSILRYALCCPQAEARQFITRVRPREAGLVDELEKGLEFEKQK